MTAPVDPDRTVFAADPDAPCADARALDGRQVPYGSAEQFAMDPPLSNCPRRDDCLCVLLFIGRGAK